MDTPAPPAPAAPQKGSKIFPDTEPFDQKDTDNIKAVIDKVLTPAGLVGVKVGSSFRPRPGKISSDLDLQVELNDIMEKLKSKVDPSIKNDKIESAARRALKDYIEKRGFQAVQKGINVFVRVPFGDKFHQVDLEAIYKVAKVSRYHQHDIPDNSPYKGVNKHLMMAILAKQMGYVWSAWEGLYTRTPENKKGPLVADEWDEIAEKLLGIKDGRNLDSVEAILKALPKAKADELLQKAKLDPNWTEIVANESFQLGTNQWFRFMMDRLSR